MSKHRKTHWIALTLVVILLISPRVAPAGDDVVTLAVGEWEPFISETLPDYGPVLEIVSRAFEHESVGVEYKFMPWNRALKLSERAEFDGTAVWGFTDERAESFHYSNAVLIDRTSFFFRNDKVLEFDSADDFVGMKTSILLGSYVGDAFDKLVERGDLTVHESKSYHKTFELLLKGRIDFVYLSDSKGRSVLENGFNQDHRDQVVVRDSFEPPYRYYLMLSRQSENGLARVRTFNNGLTKLKNSGEYDRIIKKAYE